MTDTVLYDYPCNLYIRLPISFPNSWIRLGLNRLQQCAAQLLLQLTHGWFGQVLLTKLCWNVGGGQAAQHIASILKTKMVVHCLHDSRSACGKHL